MRKLIIVLIVAVLAIIIVGGYLACTYYSSPSQNPTDNLPTTVSVDQIRDQAMVYIAANHTQTIPLMETISWTGGRQDAGLLGSEKYQYTSGNWTMMLQYPVVPNPIYTITANYTAGDGFSWMGTYQNGVLNQTSSTINAATAVTQEQIRDLTMQYLKAYHNQTTTYMQNLVWSGGRMDMGMMVGSDKYSYQSSGWNVTIQSPVVPNPTYTITAQCSDFSSEGHMTGMVVSWKGTLQDGIIIETAYSYNP